MHSRPAPNVFLNPISPPQRSGPALPHQNPLRLNPVALARANSSTPNPFLRQIVRPNRNLLPRRIDRSDGIHLSPRPSLRRRRGLLNLRTLLRFTPLLHRQRLVNSIASRCDSFFCRHLSVVWGSWGENAQQPAEQLTVKQCPSGNGSGGTPKGPKNSEEEELTRWEFGWESIPRKTEIEEAKSQTLQRANQSHRS